MNEPFRQRFAAFGIRIAARSFAGQRGPLWYADWREPGDESPKGLRYLLDLNTGHWKWHDHGGPFQPFESFQQPSIDQLLSPPVIASPAADAVEGVTSSAPDPAAAECVDRSPPPAAAEPTVQPTIQPISERLNFGLPADQEAWLHECTAAGFEIDPTPSIVSGWDTGNRWGTYQGLRELLSSRTRTVLGMYMRKWTLAEYLAMRAGKDPDQAATQPNAAEECPFDVPEPKVSVQDEINRLIMAKPFAVPMPTGPLPSVQRSLFA